MAGPLPQVWGSVRRRDADCDQVGDRTTRRAVRDVAVTTLPPVALDPDRADRIRRISDRRQKLDAQWREEITAAVEAGASLRDVAEVAGISHTAVKFIAHGRPEK